MPSWIIRRDRLDPEQKRIVDAQINSNIWISGFAGSGKSVILVHKAINILERHGYDKVNSEGVRSNGSTSLRVDILVCTENPYKLNVAENFKTQLDKNEFYKDNRKFSSNKTDFIEKEDDVIFIPPKTFSFL